MAALLAYLWLARYAGPWHGYAVNSDFLTIRQPLFIDRIFMKKEKLTPPPFTVIIDTREQNPLPFSPDIPVIREKLYPGDYSVEGLRAVFAIEKKDMSDLVGTLFGKSQNADGTTTPRLLKFTEELSAMRDIPFRAVVVTQPLRMIEQHLYQSSVPPANVIRLIADIEVATKVHFKFFEHANQAAAFVLAEMFQAWKFAHGLSSIKYTLRKMRPDRLVRDRVKMPCIPDAPRSPTRACRRTNTPSRARPPTGC